MKVSAEAVTLLILIGAGVLGGGYVAVQAATAPEPADFIVPTTQNETFRLSDHHGEVVIVDLFATWCASCKIVEGAIKDAMPSWGNASVTVISVGIDQTETMDDLRRYQDAHNITWLVARDTDHVAEKYNTYEIARVVILDAAGNVVFERSGLTSADEFRSVVAQTLAGRRDTISLVQYSVIGLAMVSGAAAFFSPCAVGMLPAYVMRAVQTGPGRVGKSLRVGAVSAFGVLVVFFGVGGLALIAGPAITRNVPFLQPLVGFLLITFGVLLLARPFSVTLQRLTSPLQAWASDVQTTKDQSNAAFLTYGIAYGAAAAGCTAPVLLSVLVTAAAYGSLVGTLIVAAYAFTGAFFMITVTVLAAAAGGRLAPLLGRFSRPIEILSALAIIGGGLFLIWYAARAGTFAAHT